LTLDGESFKGDGRTMKIRRDRTGNKPRRPPPPRVAGSLTVYVGNMPWAASKEEVEAMLSDAGCAVSSMRYHTDAETGQFRGFVHAELADESSLQNALALAGTRWRGRELRVSHSETGKKR
jgi:RNA recognition motif-containing protein